MHSPKRVRIGLVLLWLAALVIFVAEGQKGNSAVELAFGTLYFGAVVATLLSLGLPDVVAGLRQWVAGNLARALALPLGAWILALLYGVAFGEPRGLWALLVYLPAPVLFVFAAKKVGEKANLWDLAAILGIWFPIELGWVGGPDLPPGHGVMGLGHILGMVMALYAYLVVREFKGIGYRFDLSRKDVGWAVVYFLMFMPIALIVGLSTGFLHVAKHSPSVFELLAAPIAIFLFTGIPEEVLFRGLIQNSLSQRIREKSRWHPWALILASIIFGWAHANNRVPPLTQWHLGPLGTISVPWVYVVLATVAGVFYGLTYLRTGKVTAAAIMHALVDAVWGMFLAG